MSLFPEDKLLTMSREAAFHFLADSLLNVLMSHIPSKAEEMHIVSTLEALRYKTPYWPVELYVPWEHIKKTTAFLGPWSLVEMEWGKLIEYCTSAAKCAKYRKDKGKTPVLMMPIKTYSPTFDF